MANDGIVQIHGKDYMTVARRLELAHEGKKLVSVKTEILNHDPVVIRAEVVMKDKDEIAFNTFTGISSVALNSMKQIEKANPYEVAETSAVGRALGFAGIGLIESVASADEMVKGAAGGQAIAMRYSNGMCKVCHAPDGKPHATSCTSPDAAA